MSAASATGTAGAYGLPYMTGSPTELTATPQQLWNAQGKFIGIRRRTKCDRGRIDRRPIFRTTGLGTTGLSAISEDYGSSGKSSGTVTHQALPAFSQPFCGRPSFRGYSPSYSTQQNTTGVGATVEPSTWSYGSPSNDTLATQYAAPSRRQPVVNSPSTPAQHQLTATASLSTSKYAFFVSGVFFSLYSSSRVFSPLSNRAFVSPHFSSFRPLSPLLSFLPFPSFLPRFLTRHLPSARSRTRCSNDSARTNDTASNGIYVYAYRRLVGRPCRSQDGKVSRYGCPWTSFQKNDKSSWMTTIREEREGTATRTSCVVLQALVNYEKRIRSDPFVPLAAYRFVERTSRGKGGREIERGHSTSTRVVTNFFDRTATSVGRNQVPALEKRISRYSFSRLPTSPPFPPFLSCFLPFFPLPPPPPLLPSFIVP